MGDSNSVAANVLGTIGTVLWCVQLIPQIIHNYRHKNCEGFPPIMMLLWVACGIPFGIYFISTDASIPVQVQPEVFFIFSSISWAQCLYYPPVKLPKRKIALQVGLMYALAIGLQGGLIPYFKKNYKDDPGNWRILIFGILASILLALGLLPPYFELLKRQGRVVGINFVFLAVDCSGALFSMFSVIFGNMDIMGIVLYTICAALEIGIFTSHLIWCMRFKWFGNAVKNKLMFEQEDSDEKTIQNENVPQLDGHEANVAEPVPVVENLNGLEQSPTNGKENSKDNNTPNSTSIIERTKKISDISSNDMI